MAVGFGGAAVGGVGEPLAGGRRPWGCVGAFLSERLERPGAAGVSGGGRMVRVCWGASLAAGDSEHHMKTRRIPRELYALACSWDLMPYEAEFSIRRRQTWERSCWRERDSSATPGKRRIERDI